MRKRTKQTGAGFSLVEVLVSLCILSLGVIGAASIQLTALRTTQQSGFHNIALQLATDVADQVRISEASNPLLTLDFKSSEQAAIPAALCYGAAAGCDGASMVAFASYEVQRRLQNLLPQGRIKVCRDATPWDDKAQTYHWDCGSAGSDAPIVVKVGWRNPGEVKAGAATLAAVPQFVLLVRS
ncbi:type IV pilus modification protein PilV [Noviherbaspirillum sedimenti]|uniref:Type IV pilus modification protein PilV n=1 Tax=Noviherbaspirillum sedimenti TaxID=2320865 RepID=A0A3A3FZU7_9BURK|nr:type IV pilus modification protein PilV [Noviherbaspirillum sedimenti]RJG01728.1 type IV pilus modification protein PilV [Noviherbaspirillum sedimenti]